MSLTISLQVIVECQSHKDYQDSLTWLLGFLEEYFGHAKTTASKGKDSHAALSSDPSLNQALAELTTLLERFANGQSLSPVTQRVQVLADDAQNDEHLRRWFGDVDGWARRCLLEPGYVLQPQCNDDGAKIRDRGREFYDGKYKGHFDGVFDALGAFFGAMGDDPLNARFGQDWARLTKDLLFDSEGSLKFKPELWGDIRKVILPSLIDHVGYVPIPRVEYTDDGTDLVLENITLQGRNLFPKCVSLFSVLCFFADARSLSCSLFAPRSRRFAPLRPPAASSRSTRTTTSSSRRTRTSTTRATTSLRCPSGTCRRTCATSRSTSTARRARSRCRTAVLRISCWVGRG